MYQRSYKKLLKNLPVGIILFDHNEDEPIFYNRAVAKIVAKKSQRASVSSANSPQSATVYRDVTLRSLQR